MYLKVNAIKKPDSVHATELVEGDIISIETPRGLISVRAEEGRIVVDMNDVINYVEDQLDGEYHIMLED